MGWVLNYHVDHGARVLEIVHASAGEVKVSTIFAKYVNGSKDSAAGQIASALRSAMAHRHQSEINIAKPSTRAEFPWVRYVAPDQEDRPSIYAVHVRS